MHGEGDTLVIDIGAAPEQSDKRDGDDLARHRQGDGDGRRSPAARIAGATLSYHHPVRELTPIGMWKGEAMTLRLPLKDLKTMGGDCLIALLQVENAGPILGAAEYEVASHEQPDAARPSSSGLEAPQKQNGPANRPVELHGDNCWRMA